MKLHELWTVTAERETEDGVLVVEGKTSEEAPIQQYFVEKNPEANKGQWSIIGIQPTNAAPEDRSTN